MEFKKSTREVKVKKFLVRSIMLALLPVAFIAGCGNKTPTSADNSPTPVATINPVAYLTPQATPQAPVVLLTAANYAILSYTGISNSGPSTLCGNYGVYPDGLTSVTGSPAIVMNCSGTSDVADGSADQAKLDLGTAYTNVATRAGGAIIPAGGDIGGQTLYPGLYSDGGNLNITSANLTLDAQGNANAVFIFQVAGVLNVANGRQVILANSAQAANVTWQVSSYCALGTTASFVGTIMAYTSVTLNTGAVLTGRALAENADVTLLSNTITHP